MENSFAKDVFDTLNGNLRSEFRVPGVEDLFEEGKPCMELYSTVWDAYLRLLERLGKQDDDEDVEIIINAMLDMVEVVGFAMYHYGAKFGERESKSCPCTHPL